MVVALKTEIVKRVNLIENKIDSDCDKVVIEQPITIIVKDVGLFTLLCTPTDIEALAIGFLFSEGIINAYDEIIELSTQTENEIIVAVEVENPQQHQAGRNLIVTSSCGLCGIKNMEKIKKTIQPASNTLTLKPEQLFSILDQLQTQQVLFKKTGATHAAGIFNAEGKIITMAEDIGRHNAMDKTIGQCLSQTVIPAKAGIHIPENKTQTNITSSYGIALSGRVSYEMVVKAARAGLEMIIAVSAPTSLAIEIATHWQITLCGFVRQKSANIYTHGFRIQ